MHEMAPSAVLANMTAYTAAHRAPAADLHPAFALCLQGRLFVRCSSFHSQPCTHTEYGSTEHVKVKLCSQAAYDGVAQIVGTWHSNVASGNSSLHSCQNQNDKKANIRSEDRFLPGENDSYNIFNKSFVKRMRMKVRVIQLKIQAENV